MPLSAKFAGRSGFLDWGMVKDKIHGRHVHFKQKSMLIVLKYTLMRSLEKLYSYY